MCTFLHPHVHVTANLQPGKRIRGTRHKKPFEDFASHPLYSISGGKLSQRTKNVVANECRGIKKKKKKAASESVPASQSDWIQSGQRSFPEECSKIRGMAHFKHIHKVAPVCERHAYRREQQRRALPLSLQPS